MNRHVQQLVQEVSHTLLKERVRDNAFSLITDAEKEQVRDQVVKLFETQDLPLDSERLNAITNELVAVKNAQIQSAMEQTKNPVNFEKGQIFVHRRLDISDFKKLSKKEQDERVCAFVLSHMNQSQKESENFIKIHTEPPHYLGPAVSIFSFLGILGFLLTGGFMSPSIPTYLFMILCLPAPIVLGGLACNKYSRIRENQFKLIKDPALDYKKANRLALDLMGIPKSVFSEQAYSLYAKHMAGQGSAHFNFLEPVDLTQEKTIDFIEKTGIEKHLDSKQTLEKWKSTNNPIRHMELMALGVVATNLAA